MTRSTASMEYMRRCGTAARRSDMLRCNASYITTAVLLRLARLEEVPRTGGGSDGNFTAALGVPTLDGLGIDGEGAHTLHEYGLISSIAPRQKLMARLLETLG